MLPKFALLCTFTVASHALPILRRQAPEPFVLPVPAEGPGPTFDATATRAATGVQIRNAANPSVCFDVSDFRAGDFRFNLVPLALKPCDASVEGQKFDLITKGEHNNVPDGSRTLIVSSQQFTCVDRRSNKNDRTRPGLFACGGRAAGDGETTADQQFFFNSTANLASGIGFTLVRDSVNNGIGPGNTCMSFDADGFVQNTPCSPPNFTPEQTWIIGDASGGSPPSVPTPDAPVSPSPASSAEPVAPTSEQPVPEEPSQCPADVETVTVVTTVTVQPTPTQVQTQGPAISLTSSIPAGGSVTFVPLPQATDAPAAERPEEFVLPVPKEGPGPKFDSTATRAASSVQIRNAAQPDLCFDVSNFKAGDFRFNLVPIALKKCDASIAGQKFDLITKGEHNNVADESRVIIVSSQQFTCVDRRGNINDRNRPGLFACGGRAAGDGETSFDQQFFFDKTADLTEGIGFPTVRDAQNNGVGTGNQCLTLGTDGFLSNTPCSPPNLTPEQTWIVA
ncbi:hypothetical protein CC1G_03733 [Coprinopsis cinerea okayama7|uniref:Ricin B lectin domain-containing protein n=1 Tax=Coprinopsis cinerea (strain Okayama-7 / 130 / ATCC MYA-4618 / FGSC 9003) TaxID=240176 RepID=A8N240_COPC7|nr:hypothetical protein CC1G_03733 [Coprinopsis cinerea okayama7\|eukprot:XP_001828939.2 hypothetical protein CC1G_03733 [Coprinopsis cinerea okayama7\